MVTRLFLLNLQFMSSLRSKQPSLICFIHLYKLSEIKITLLMSKFQLCTGEIRPKENDLITTIPFWGPAYELSVDLSMDSWDNGSLLLFRAKTDGDCCSVGQRVPAIWTQEGHGLLVATNIGQDGNSETRVEVPDKEGWFNLEVSQKSNGVTKTRLLIFFFILVSLFFPFRLISTLK